MTVSLQMFGKLCEVFEMLEVKPDEIYAIIKYLTNNGDRPDLRKEK